MPKSDHREPIKFVGMYFIDEHGEDYRTGQIVAQISASVMAIIWPSSMAQTITSRQPHWKCCPPPTSTRSATIVAHAIGNFFPDVKTRQRWITWLTTPDPAKDKMGKVVHLKPKPDQPA